MVYPDESALLKKTPLYANQEPCTNRVAPYREGDRSSVRPLQREPERMEVRCNVSTAPPGEIVGNQVMCSVPSCCGPRLDHGVLGRNLATFWAAGAHGLDNTYS